MFDRTLDLSALLAHKSVLLLGPRMTGKSTLVRNTLLNALSIDLLEPRTFRALSAAPEELEQRALAFLQERPKSEKPVVMVDEIQKLPQLLDVVHRMIEREPRIRFILTGSSARKLKHSSVNLLGGRATRARLYPLTSAEVRDADYVRLMHWGGLPAVLTSEQPKNDLLDYVGLYLKEEIQAEGLTRSIGNFSRFLEVASLYNTEQVIFSNVANDAQMPARTVREHFQILEDTLVGTLLPAYRHSVSRKAMSSARFYFFDVGVANALASRWDFTRASPDYGRCLEHLIFCELTAALGYFRAERTLTYWRSLSKLEVDFVIEKKARAEVGIEVKATRHASEGDFRGLCALAEDEPKMRKIMVCEESAKRMARDGIEVWPVEQFLAALWAGQVLTS